MINKAIKFFGEEIVRIRKAPEINGCEMTPEWKEMLQIYNTAVEALRLRKAPKTNFEHIKAMSVEEMAELLCGCSDCTSGLYYGKDLCRYGHNGYLEWLESEVIE